MLRVISQAALALLAFAFVAALFLAAPLPTGQAAPTPVLQNAPDFSISVTPVSAVRKRGTGELYDIAVTSVNGFSGTINFTVTGLPPGSNIPFPPPSIIGSATSSFSILTSKTLTPIGTFTLTITGTSGALSHSQQVTLQMR